MSNISPEVRQLRAEARSAHARRALYATQAALMVSCLANLALVLWSLAR